MDLKRLYRFASLYRMAITRQMTRDDAAQILDVPVGASNDEVMAAWRQKAVQWHPDRNPGQDTTAIMAKINMAKDLMTGRQWRVMYETDRPAPPGAEPPGPPPGYGGGNPFAGSPFEDFWRAWQEAARGRGGGVYEEEEEEDEEPEESPAGGRYYSKYQGRIEDGFENSEQQPQFRKVSTRIPLGAGAEMSVVAGDGLYSRPRRMLENLNKYLDVEMAILGPDGDIIQPGRILGEDHPFDRWTPSYEDVIPYIPIKVAKDLIGYVMEVIKNEGWSPADRPRRRWAYESEEPEPEPEPEPSEAYKEYKSRIDGSFVTPKQRGGGRSNYRQPGVSSATFKVGNVKIIVRGGSNHYSNPDDSLSDLNRYRSLEIYTEAGGSPVSPEDILGESDFDDYYDDEGVMAHVPVQVAKNYVGEVMKHMEDY
jgi:hypothetical protein